MVRGNPSLPGSTTSPGMVDDMSTWDCGGCGPLTHASAIVLSWRAFLTILTIESGICGGFLLAEGLSDGDSGINSSMKSSILILYSIFALLSAHSCELRAIDILNLKVMKPG